MPRRLRRHFPDRFRLREKQRLRCSYAAIQWSAKSMTLICSCCQSEFVVARRKVQKSAAATGLIFGAIQGASTALTRAKTGNRNTPGQLKISLIASAMFGGLLGAAGGCGAGAAIGETIEQSLPNNYRCNACGHVFGLASS